MPEQVTPPSAIRPTADERIVRCPACGGDSVYSPRNRFRPFCSERCRQVDLGAWASEDFRMPVDAKPDAEFGDPRLLKVPSSGHL